MLPIDASTVAEMMLLFGGEAVVRGSVALAQRLGVSPLIVGLTIVGFGTSLPEMVVSVNAALVGSPGLAVGNVIGSTIANILLILGVAALIAPFAVHPAAVRRDALAMGIVTLAYVGLGMTGQIVFWHGIAMLVIANGLEIDGKGTGLLLSLAAKIETALGPGGRLVFLIGAWAAIVSSLLGVWQSVPMLFADAMQCLRGTPPVAIEDLPTTRSARWFLLALATIPLLQASIGFAAAQKAYAIYGAYFLPLLAVVLLALNGRVGLVGALRNRPWTALALLALLAFFAFAGLAGLA